jgi:hypothetical protein
MIPNQNPKAGIALYSAAVGSSSDVTGPTIDAKGADTISITVMSRGAGAASTNGLTTVKLQHATSDASSAFADISGVAFTTQMSQSTATDSTAAACFVSTSLVGKRRYLRLVTKAHSSVTANQTVVALFTLDNLVVAGTVSGAVATVVA